MFTSSLHWVRSDRCWWLSLLQVFMMGRVNVEGGLFNIISGVEEGNEFGFVE